ncbi:MAG: ribbon-helix-helix protein, CopG family [Vampirovibrionales bacterium]|nr:ribbon-helix-helix protein, CopG family [Vampirovibrionales bacterium]
MARVLISMKDEFLKRIDELAEEEQRSRSELIREALRHYIRRRITTGTSAKSEQEAQTLESLLE